MAEVKKRLDVGGLSRDEPERIMEEEEEEEEDIETVPTAAMTGVEKISEEGVGDRKVSEGQRCRTIARLVGKVWD